MDDGRRRGQPAATTDVTRRRVRSLEQRGTEQRRWQRGLRAGDVGVLVAMERYTLPLIARLLRLPAVTYSLTISNQHYRQ